MADNYDYEQTEDENTIFDRAWWKKHENEHYYSMLINKKSNMIWEDTNW